jgi:ketosteroid isomerase-like protein
LRNQLAFVVLALAPLRATHAQAISQDSLYKVVSALDSAVFDAYNRCEIEKMASYFSKDLEFYHDQGGLSVGLQALRTAMQQNICGKVRRTLVEGTLQVFPLQNYGAVVTVEHLFCNSRKARCDKTDEIAKATTLWDNRDGTWKATRVISYDHTPGKP